MSISRAYPCAIAWNYTGQPAASIPLPPQLPGALPLAGQLDRSPQPGGSPAIPCRPARGRDRLARAHPRGVRLKAVSRWTRTRRSRCGRSTTPNAGDGQVARRCRSLRDLRFRPPHAAVRGPRRGRRSSGTSSPASLGEVGTGVDGWAVGDRVCVYPFAPIDGLDIPTALASGIGLGHQRRWLRRADGLRREHALAGSRRASTSHTARSSSRSPSGCTGSTSRGRGRARASASSAAGRSAR